MSKYSKDMFIAHIKKAVVDIKAENEPTSGRVCAVASLRTIRDGLLDDLFDLKSEKEWDEEQQAQAQAIRESFLELINDVRNKASDGFASNASAAAKAAGFKTSAIDRAIAEQKD